MANDKLPWFWFSFMLDDVNQGCMNVQGKCVHDAMTNAQNLGIVPESDDVFTCQIDKPELEPNKLISREDMIKNNYKRITD